MMFDVCHHSIHNHGEDPQAYVERERFRAFLTDSEPFDFDIMLEIKDKEASAAKAVMLVTTDRRFVG